MINCTEAVRQLWDYIENGLVEAEREKIDEHLGYCRRCCGEVAFAEEMRAVLRQATTPTVPPVVSERLEAYLAELEAPPK